MKIKVIVLIGILLGLGTALLFHRPQKAPAKLPEVKSALPSTTPTPVPLRLKSAFVPYWSTVTSESDFETYDRIMYFGVTVSKSGIVKDDPGFLKMKQFLTAVSDKPQEKWLTIRMIDTDNNLAILNSLSSWDPIASDTAALVKEHSFDGVVLDLEMAALPSDGLRKRIVEFVTAFHKKLQSDQVPLALTIYGDTFYRKRPYDLEALSNNAEEIMIMAYDFHKTYGESGPNFQFSGRDTYGYDFGLMVRDFLLFVPENKLTVIYGMFGYDWLVDEKKRPIKPAASLTLHQVRQKFLDSCESKNCIVRRDEKAHESEVNYIDADGGYHIVWFEDQVSVDKKSEFMRSRGIDSIAYWAYGYF